MVLEKHFWTRIREAGEENKKLIGDFPQTRYQQSGIMMDDWANPGHMHTQDWRKPPSPEFKVPMFIAKPKTKPTDIIGTNTTFSRHMVVSPRCKDLFDQFRLPNHKVYETIVKFNSFELPYFYYYLYEEQLNAIDFQASAFRYNQLMGPPQDFVKGNHFEVANVEEYLKLVMECELLKEKDPDIAITVKAEPLYLDESFREQDMIRLSSPFLGLFVNQHLFQAMLREQITGWSYQNRISYEYYGIQKFVTPK